MKNRAFTVAETLIAMVIIGILVVVALNVMQPKETNYNIFFSAGWDNLMKANQELIYRNEQAGGSGLPENYCEALADLLTTKEVKCNQKIVLPNGLTFNGFPNFRIGTVGITNMSLKGHDGTHGFMIFKEDGMVKPMDDDFDSTETFKFRVVTNDGELLEDTKEGVSFKDALCLARGTYYGEWCSQNSRDEKCPFTYSCKIEIVMPSGMKI